MSGCFPGICNHRFGRRPNQCRRARCGLWPVIDRSATIPCRRPDRCRCHTAIATNAFCKPATQEAGRQRYGDTLPPPALPAAQRRRRHIQPPGHRLQTNPAPHSQRTHKQKDRTNIMPAAKKPRRSRRLPDTTLRTAETEPPRTTPPQGTIQTLRLARIRRTVKNAPTAPATRRAQTLRLRLVNTSQPVPQSDVGKGGVRKNRVQHWNRLWRFGCLQMTKAPRQTSRKFAEGPKPKNITRCDQITTLSSPKVRAPSTGASRRFAASNGNAET